MSVRCDRGELKAILHALGEKVSAVRRQPALRSTMSNRFRVHAEALWALHQTGLLGSAHLKESVKRIIYQSSETPHWHHSAHYRSTAAGQKIAKALEAGIVHSVASYHRFCNATENRMRHEHMVPTKVVYRLILGHSAPSATAYEEILTRCGFRATILEDEDQRLWRSDVPNFAAFTCPSDPGFYDHLCRYSHPQHGEPIALDPRPKDGWVVTPVAPLVS
jgi:hypothetical protein